MNRCKHHVNTETTLERLIKGDEKERNTEFDLNLSFGRK